jgi:hypothetical protein
MAGTRILEQTPYRLVIATTPRINNLIKSLVIAGLVGAILIGPLWVILANLSNTGSLTRLECFHKEHLTCKMTTVDALGEIINQSEVSPVQKVDIFPVLTTKEVCTARGEDSDCQTVKYYRCRIRLHSPQTSLAVPISQLTQETHSLAESCPTQNAISSQFQQLISGVLKVGYWEEDTRIGDVLTRFKRDIAAYIPAVFLGLTLLLNLLTNRQKIWIFDKLTQTAKLQTKKLLGKTITRTCSTRNLTLLDYCLNLWEKRGDRFFKIDSLDYQTTDEKRFVLEAVEPFLCEEFRSYQIEDYYDERYYIFDKTRDFIALYRREYSKYDYHGPLVWSIDRLTRKIKFTENFTNKAPASELGWEEVQAIKYGTYSIRLVSSWAHIDLVSTTLYKPEQIGGIIAEFMRVPLLKAQ